MTRPLTAPGHLVAGRYRLQSQIGGGGMGAVWLARDELLGRQVAVKQVLSPPSANPAEIDEQRQRALREGRIAARLSHPHAISVYDVALESGQPWLVMEYLPSRSLATVIAEDGVLRVDQVAQIGAQVADALAATHAAGIVHRDVKPANILIGEGGRVEGLVKITDFGISHASGDVTLTQTGQITGTPAFLAPEVAQGQPMTEASDVFSLGATLYTCLEGQPPFGMEDNALGMLHRVAGGQIRPPLRAGSLAEPLQRILAADPAHRPTMVEVRDELAKLAAGRDGDTTTVLLARTDLGSGGQGRSRTAAFATPTPLPAENPAPAPSTSPPAERPPRRKRWALLAFLSGAAMVAALVIWLVTARDDDGGGTAQPPSPTTSAQETQPEEPPPSTEPASPPAEQEQEPEPPADEPDTVSRGEVNSFLNEYHRLVVEDPAAAYQRTGPTLRGVISQENYIAFWEQFEDVRVRELEIDVDNLQATGELEFRYPDGGRETEQHRFTLVQGEDGELLMDEDVAL